LLRAALDSFCADQEWRLTDHLRTRMVSDGRGHSFIAARAL
jgi:hypothetical protein